jgi:site-specific recombinase XerD
MKTSYPGSPTELLIVDAQRARLRQFDPGFDGANLLKRRLRDADIVGDYSPHSFSATGITNYLENGGTLEVAQRIAGHADSRTTKLYDRRGQKVLLEDMERIRY